MHLSTSSVADLMLCHAVPCPNPNPNLCQGGDDVLKCMKDNTTVVRG